MGISWTFIFARPTFEVHFYRIPRYKVVGAQSWLFIYLECQNQELLENIYPKNLLYNSEMAPCILVGIPSSLSEGKPLSIFTKIKKSSEQKYLCKTKYIGGVNK